MFEHGTFNVFTGRLCGFLVYFTLRDIADTTPFLAN